MFKSNNKGFTLIELLVVIAVVGILATLAVIALQQVRSRARDSKRMADMKQVQTALELFFNENGRYPTTDEWNDGVIISSSGEVFMYNIPVAPIPADGECLEASNTYVYTPQNDGSSYTIDFCIGEKISSLLNGAKHMTPSGIINGSSQLEIPSWLCEDILMDSRDSQSYQTVQINDQCWMKENLKYLPSVIGSTIGSTTVPYYYVYGYEGTDVNSAKLSSNYLNYGVLYNYLAAVSACPLGWHLPSDDEWKTLEKNIGMTQVEADKLSVWRGTVEGNKLKSCRQVSSPLGGACNTSIHPRFNSDATHYGVDDYDFSVLPGGYRTYTSAFFRSIGVQGIFWTSTPYGVNIAYDRFFSSAYSTIYRNANNYDFAFSVRCIKD